jgi:hypothetical protein
LLANVLSSGTRPQPVVKLTLSSLALLAAAILVAPFQSAGLFFSVGLSRTIVTTDIIGISGLGDAAWNPTRMEHEIKMAPGPGTSQLGCALTLTKISHTGAIQRERN